MSICVIFHEGSKTFGYGFFLERAKSTINKTRISVLPPIITKYVLPIYISLYFVLYSILCPLEFRGLSIEPNNVPTACLFDEYESWVFYLSVGVEIFNSIFFVWLFAYPLYKIIGRSNSKNQNIEQLEVIKIVKYNIAFSSISCISSVTFLFYRAFARNNQLGHYLWLAGNIDLVINVICTFLMVTVNRKYIKYFCCQKKQKKTGKQKHNNDNKDNIQSDNMTVTNIECTSLLIQDQISNMTVTNIEVEGKDREMYESKTEQIQTFEPTVETHYAERTTTADRMKQNFTQISLF